MSQVRWLSENLWKGSVRTKIMKIHITIKLFATLKKYSPPDADNYPVTPGNTIMDLVDLLGLSEDEAKIIFIDGVKATLDSGLQGGETVSIFPPIGGG